MDDCGTDLAIPVLATYQRLTKKKKKRQKIFSIKKYKAMSGMLEDAEDETEMFFWSGGWGCGKIV